MTDMTTTKTAIKVLGTFKVAGELKPRSLAFEVNLVRNNVDIYFQTFPTVEEPEAFSNLMYIGCLELIPAKRDSIVPINRIMQLVKKELSGNVLGEVGLQ